MPLLAGYRRDNSTSNLQVEGLQSTHDASSSTGGNQLVPEIPWRTYLGRDKQPKSVELRQEAENAIDADSQRTQSSRWNYFTRRSEPDDAQKQYQEECKWMTLFDEEIPRLRNRVIAFSSKNPGIAQRVFGCPHDRFKQYVESLEVTANEAINTWRKATYPPRNEDSKKMAEKLSAAICDLLSLMERRLKAGAAGDVLPNQGRLPINDFTPTLAILG